MILIYRTNGFLSKKHGKMKVLRILEMYYYRKKNYAAGLYLQDIHFFFKYMFEYKRQYGMTGSVVLISAL